MKKRKKKFNWETGLKLGLLHELFGLAKPLVRYPCNLLLAYFLLSKAEKPYTQLSGLAVTNKLFWETRRLINHLFGVTPIHLYGVCCLIQEIRLILVLKFAASFVSVLLREWQFWVSYKFRHISSYCSSPSHFWVLASKPKEESGWICLSGQR